MLFDLGPKALNFHVFMEVGSFNLLAVVETEDVQVGSGNKRPQDIFRERNTAQ